MTLAPFFDAGVDKILRASQLTMDRSRVNDLNTQFPQAGFDGQVKIAPGTQKMRASTGLELQVMLPVVNAPFRLYWAYNPSIVRQYLQPPIVADRSAFPNAATFLNSVAQYGQALPVLRKADDVPFYNRQDVLTLESSRRYGSIFTLRSFQLEEEFVVFRRLLMGMAAMANAQAAAPTKVAIINVQKAILQTKDGQKAAGELQAKFTPEAPGARKEAGRSCGTCRTS